MRHHASGLSRRYRGAALLILATLLGLPGGCGLKAAPEPPPGAVAPYPFP